MLGDRYRAIVPDYRGAGLSSKPNGCFTKSAMAGDFVQLLDNLSISEPIHVVGHDIGGMIAYAFASRYPERTASVVWGECPLPGTSIHDEDRTIYAQEQFHFLFHAVSDLPELLVTGSEAAYLDHFYSKLAHNRSAITPRDLDHYAGMYSKPGALRCGFGVYRAFLKDAEENRQWVSEKGKCKVRTMGLHGKESRELYFDRRMLDEVHEEGTFRVEGVPESGHWIAEENPRSFAEIVLGFITEVSV